MVSDAYNPRVMPALHRTKLATGLFFGFSTLDVLLLLLVLNRYGMFGLG